MLHQLLNTDTPSKVLPKIERGILTKLIEIVNQEWQMLVNYFKTKSILSLVKEIVLYINDYRCDCKIGF